MSLLSTALTGMAAYVLLGLVSNDLDARAVKKIDARASGVQDITGLARVIDGDTIEIGYQRIRLYGIDAPEWAQECKNAVGQSYRCGEKAARALTALVRGKTVHCERRDVDSYGRAVALCTANDTDLNGTMVEMGLAVAYHRYSDIYKRSEDAARAAHGGLWAGPFEMPWDYRRRQSPHR